MKNETISHLQFGLLLVSMAAISMILHFTYLVYQVDPQGWWVTVLAAALVATLLNWPVAALLQRYPGRSLVEIARLLWGPVWGSVLPLPVFLALGSGAVFVLRGLAEIVLRTLLPLTPITITMAMAALVSGYLASLGPEGMGRYAEIVVFLIVIPLLLPVLLSALANVNPLYLEPLLVWPAGLPLSPYFIGAAIFLFGGLSLSCFAPFLTGGLPLWRPVLWAAGVSTFLLLFVTALPLGTFGPEAARAEDLPMLVLLNAVPATFLFIQQLSYTTVAIWSLLLFLAAAVNTWSMARGLAEVLHQKARTNQLTWPAAGAVYLGTLLLEDYPVYRSLFPVWAAATALVYVWVAVVFWPVAWWKGAGTDDAGRG